jgi:predicted component of type VI protein secretion system
MPELVVVEPEIAPGRFVFRDGAVLGRSPECEVVVAHPSVSRLHARIARDADGWVLADLGSRNGTRVNGRRVERVRLADGDRVELGEVRLEFRSAPETGAAATALEFAEELVLPSGRARGSGAEHGVEPSVEIEGEELLAETAVRPRAGAGQSGADSTAGVGDERAAPARPDPRAALDAATLRRAELVRQMRAERSSGLAGGDWEQLPGALRLAAVVAGLALAAGAAWGAFWIVRTLRGP